MTEPFTGGQKKKKNWMGLKPGDLKKKKETNRSLIIIIKDNWPIVQGACLSKKTTMTILFDQRCTQYYTQDGQRD